MRVATQCEQKTLLHKCIIRSVMASVIFGIASPCDDDLDELTDYEPSSGTLDGNGCTFQDYARSLPCGDVASVSFKRIVMLSSSESWCIEKVITLLWSVT